MEILNMNSIVFKLNEAEKIIIELEDTLEDVRCCNEALMFFVQDTKKFLFSSYEMKDVLDNLEFMIEKALKNDLQMHESINGNLAYLFAKRYFCGSDQTLLKNLDHVIEDRVWVGYKHFLCATDVAMWIYNGKDGSIILEYTPWYEITADAGYNQDQILIENYKPLVTTIVTRSIALEWLAQVKLILKQIDENIERHRYRL